MMTVPLILGYTATSLESKFLEGGHGAYTWRFCAAEGHAGLHTVVWLVLHLCPDRVPVFCLQNRKTMPSSQLTEVFVDVFICFRVP